MSCKRTLQRITIFSNALSRTTINNTGLHNHCRLVKHNNNKCTKQQYNHPQRYFSSILQTVRDVDDQINQQQQTTIQKLKSINITAIKSNNQTNRFYKNVTIVSTNDIYNLPHNFIEPIQQDLYSIRLDNHYLTTPDNRLFTVPTYMLAHYVSFEWDLQNPKINIDMMPITHICMIAIDQAHTDRFKNHFINYIKFDSTCIRATQPSPLVRLQNKIYNPMIERMNDMWNIKLNISRGIMTPTQSDITYDNIQQLLSQQSSYGLACLEHVCSISKSFVIGWNMFTNELDIDETYNAARLDEDYQISQFGQIEGAFGHNVDITYVRMRIAAVKCILNSLNIQSKHNTKIPVDKKIQHDIDTNVNTKQTT